MHITNSLKENKNGKPYPDGDVLEPYLTCRDHTVSRETFDLFHHKESDLLVTVPQPQKDALPSYYESEEYISHTDSKESLHDKVYQFIKRYSLKRKLKLINRLSASQGKLLDIGCGTGDLLSVCEKDGWEVLGVEPNDKARELAAGKLKSGKGILPELDKLIDSHHHTFNVITMWHVLEHIPDLMDYIGSLKSLLHKEGHLIIAVPNFKSYDADHYKEFWAAFDVPRHLWHFSQHAIRSIFEQFDFKVVETLPLIFDSFYVSLLSEKYKTGSSNLLSAFKTGLMSNIKATSTGEYSSLIYVIKNK